MLLADPQELHDLYRVLCERQGAAVPPHHELPLAQRDAWYGLARQSVPIFERVFEKHDTIAIGYVLVELLAFQPELNIPDEPINNAAFEAAVRQLAGILMSKTEHNKQALPKLDHWDEFVKRKLKGLSDVLNASDRVGCAGALVS